LLESLKSIAIVVNKAQLLADDRTSPGAAIRAVTIILHQLTARSPHGNGVRQSTGNPVQPQRDAWMHCPASL